MINHQPAIPIKESAIRDFLADNLNIVESGLTYLSKEFKLKNKRGAGGSIDILARDSDNTLVVVELKRADQTARQALHELEKYVALLAADCGIRVDQLRCILVSTTWHELLVPFARFVGHADFHTTGLILHLDSAGNPTSTQRVELPILDSGLEACPHHIQYLYTSEAERDRASDMVDKTLDELSIADHFRMHLSYEGDRTDVVFPHGLYVVLAEFSHALSAHIEELLPECVSEEYEDSAWAHEDVALGHLTERIPIETAEIAFPDRFKSMIDWKVSAVIGMGRYGNQKVWNADQLTRVAGANGDRNTALFEKIASFENRAEWHRMRLSLMSCIRGTAAWPQIIDALMQEFEASPASQVSIHAYNPTDILFGLDHLMRSDGDMSYLPQLKIEYRIGEQNVLYAGLLLWNGSPPLASLADIVGVVFQDFWNYLVAKNTGEYWTLDAEMCGLHGLDYVVMQFLPNDERTFRLNLDNDGSILRELHSDDNSEVRPWVEFLRENQSYLSALVEEFDSVRLRPGLAALFHEMQE